MLKAMVVGGRACGEEKQRLGTFKSTESPQEQRLSLMLHTVAF